jgi:hypothetical protein
VGRALRRFAERWLQAVSMASIMSFCSVSAAMKRRFMV